MRVIRILAPLLLGRGLGFFDGAVGPESRAVNRLPEAEG